MNTEHADGHAAAAVRPMMNFARFFRLPISVAIHHCYTGACLDLFACLVCHGFVKMVTSTAPAASVVAAVATFADSAPAVHEGQLAADQQENQIGPLSRSLAIC